jgi:tetratricopeptide (TPR) repeat protein
MTSLLNLAFVISMTLFANGQASKTDAREDTAKAFFAAAKYPEAIEIYSQLFARYLSPRYIFNIGRCYENMSDPDKALQSFREYERKVKTMDPSQRKELDGHIKEMADLKAQRERLANKLTAAAKDEPAPTPAAERGTNDSSSRTSQPAQAPRGSDKADKQESPQAAVDRFLATMRSNPEKYWREHALNIDEAKLAKTVALVKNAKVDDPRLAEYQLHLGNQYAGKHFTLRLQKLQSQAAPDSHEVASGERKLGPEISSTFNAAAEYYLAASEHKKFARMPDVLMGLAVLLEANSMESRARVLLLQLLRTFPESEHAETVRGNN